MYYKLYLQRKAAEFYPDNPDGESKARLEMIDELQSKGFNITCFGVADDALISAIVGFLVELVAA